MERKFLMIFLIELYFSVCLLLPYTVPIKLFGFSPSSVLSYILSFFSVCYVLRNRRIKGNTLSLLSIFYSYLFIYFVLLLLGSDMNLKDQTENIKQTILEFLFPFFIIVLIDSPWMVKKVYRVLLILSFVLSIYGLYCVFDQSNPLFFYWAMKYGDQAGVTDFMSEYRGGLEGRWGSLIGQPLFYSVFIIILFYVNLLGYYYFKKNLFFYQKCLYILVFPLLLVNLFFTGTRSSLIALCMGLLFFLFFKIKFRKILCSFVLLFTFFNFSSSFHLFGKYEPYVNSVVFFWDDTASTDNEVHGSSLDMRRDQIQGTFDEISKSPVSFLFGKGAGWPWFYMSSHHSVHPRLLGFESLFFSGLTEFGVFGFFVLYVVLFFRLFMYNIRQRHVRDYNVFLIFNAFIVSYVLVILLTGEYCFGFFLGCIAFSYNSYNSCYKYE
jgi:hypothetical protein